MRFMKRNVKRTCITISLLILLIGMCVNYYGMEIKISKDNQFVEVVVPVDVLYISDFRTVDVWIIDLSNIKNRYHISNQARKHFQTCYWGENNDLWVDGDTGIVLFQYENNEWTEYPVIDMSNGEIICVGKEYPKLIDIALVPRQILQRLE